MTEILKEVQGAFKASGKTLQEEVKARGIDKTSARVALTGFSNGPKSKKLRVDLLVESKGYLVDALRTVCQALKDEGAA
jgi:hypothetical protein